MGVSKEAKWRDQPILALIRSIPALFRREEGLLEPEVFNRLRKRDETLRGVRFRHIGVRIEFIGTSDVLGRIGQREYDDWNQAQLGLTVQFLKDSFTARPRDLEVKENEIWARFFRVGPAPINQIECLVTVQDNVNGSRRVGRFERVNEWRDGVGVRFDEQNIKSTVTRL